MPKITVADEGSGMRLDRYLRKCAIYFPQNLMEKWSRQRKVLINGERAKGASRLSPGDIITYPDDAVSQAPPEKPSKLLMSLEDAQNQVKAMIVYEDDAVLVLNKPPHLSTQGGTDQRTSLDDILQAASPDHRLRLTHRIDKETSGLVVIAKTAHAASHMTQLFRERRVQKTYLALCHGCLAQTRGVIDTPVRKGELNLAKTTPVEGQDAITHYEALKPPHTHKNGAHAQWVQLIPQTGRIHQLRIHMASIGHPIVGDEKYVGLWRKASDITQTRHELFPNTHKRMMLHAWKIAFELFGKMYAIEAPVPHSWDNDFGV